MDRTVLLLAVASAFAIGTDEREQRSYRYRGFDDDPDLLDEIFGHFPGDYIVDLGYIDTLSYDPGFYGRVDREDIKLVPDFSVPAEYPVPSFKSLRAQVGGRIRGHQVLVRRRPVSRRS